MQYQLEDIKNVKVNPNNPRIIKDDKFAKLVQSIKDFPQMLEIRPIVVNSDMIVLGGNMRLRACKEAGLKQVPIIKADNLTEEQQREFLIKDNVSGGEWDWDLLANEWDSEELSEWGLDIPNWSNGHSINNELKEHDLDNNEEFDPVGESNGYQKIVFTFNSKEDAESWITSYSEFKDIVKRQGQAWQINLTTQSI